MNAKLMNYFNTLYYVSVLLMPNFVAARYVQSHNIPKFRPRFHIPFTAKELHRKPHFASSVYNPCLIYGNYIWNHCFIRKNIYLMTNGSEDEEIYHRRPFNPTGNMAIKHQLATKLNTIVMRDKIALQQHVPTYLQNNKKIDNLEEKKQYVSLESNNESITKDKHIFNSNSQMIPVDGDKSKAIVKDKFKLSSSKNKEIHRKPRSTKIVKASNAKTTRSSEIVSSVTSESVTQLSVTSKSKFNETQSDEKYISTNAIDSISGLYKNNAKFINTENNIYSENKELLNSPTFLSTSTLNAFPDTENGTTESNLYKLGTTRAETYMISAADSKHVKRNTQVHSKIFEALEEFDRKFYGATLKKLTSISPLDRRENAISFVESGLFLYLILVTLSMCVDEQTRAEINNNINLNISDQERIKVVESVLQSLPSSSDALKFRWSTRLVVNGSIPDVSDAATALRLRFYSFNRTDSPEILMNTLNHMVEEDSGGAMRETFEEDEFTQGVRGVLLNTVYVRARWRASPTLLNGTRAFRDAVGAPARSCRMIRINDVMRYADLAEWDAQAVEISYATPGLSLLMLVPRGRSLRKLSRWVANTSLESITEKMSTLRVAVTLPIYTLRMTLLLPNKLETMGISKLVDIDNASDKGELKLSHAVQRLMFWAEAGRNAFKDDGFEWDDPPEKEVIADRPYIFYVRWRNITIINGNFVL